MSLTHTPSPEVVLTDPACSFWLRDALRGALKRDPVDALRDAEALVAVLEARLNAVISQTRRSD